MACTRRREASLGEIIAKSFEVSELVLMRRLEGAWKKKMMGKRAPKPVASRIQLGGK